MLVEWIIVERLFLSAFLGGLIGVERELNDKPAGFRTHVLVCVGSAMFTLISLSLVAPTGSGVDTMRVAAGVVTGIGFIAAGSIFRDKDRVRGMTTAADIWVLAAIGMSVALGLYVLAFMATAIALAVLIFGKFFDGFLKKRALQV